MSEPLSDAAPAEESAATPVGSIAPETQGEVVEGSAPQSEATVPAARFNGLMGKFNQTQNRVTELEAELDSLRASQSAKEQPVADSGEYEALRGQVSTLTELLMTERTENARRAALDEFPGAKPLADLITSDDPAQIREVARLIHERLSGSGTTEPVTGETPAADAAGATTTAAPAEVTATAPVVGGGAAFSGEASTSERVADAIKKRDFKGYLQAKREEAEQLAGLEG